MAWQDEFIELAYWAVFHEDLRHRFFFASNAQEISSTAGVADRLEATIVVAIYEAAIAKGFRDEETVAYERPYPGKSKGNPKRSDLAFKDEGIQDGLPFGTETIQSISRRLFIGCVFTSRSTANGFSTISMLRT